MTSTPPIHGTQHFRHDDRAVCLLVVFQHGDQCARQPQARAVQRVDEARLALVRRPVFDVGPPRLEVAHSSKPTTPPAIRSQPGAQTSTS